MLLCDMLTCNMHPCVSSTSNPCPLVPLDKTPARFSLLPLKVDISRQSQTLVGFRFLPALNKDEFLTVNPITKQSVRATPRGSIKIPEK